MREENIRGRPLRAWAATCQISKKRVTPVTFRSAYLRLARIVTRLQRGNRRVSITIRLVSRLRVDMRSFNATNATPTGITT